MRTIRLLQPDKRKTKFFIAVLTRVKYLASNVWQGLREWCGDSAYDRYVQSQRTVANSSLLTPEAFYVEQLDRRYSRPNRCC
jgi:uncharacterized short protein YbdD (DUF466 family)